jgi:hypothetical protein
MVSRSRCSGSRSKSAGMTAPHQRESERYVRTGRDLQRLDLKQRARRPPRPRRNPSLPARWAAAVSLAILAHHGERPARLRYLPLGRRRRTVRTRRPRRPHHPGTTRRRGHRVPQSRPHPVRTTGAHQSLLDPDFATEQGPVGASLRPAMRSGRDLLDMGTPNPPATPCAVRCHVITTNRAATRVPIRGYRSAPRS